MSRVQAKSTDPNVRIFVGLETTPQSTHWFIQVYKMSDGGIWDDAPAVDFDTKSHNELLRRMREHNADETHERTKKIMELIAGDLDPGPHLQGGDRDELAHIEDE